MSVHRRWCNVLITHIGRKTVFSMVPYDLKDIFSSEDEHMNDLPLPAWDRAADQLIAMRLVACLSDGVCVLKEAARQMKEQTSLS